MYAVYTSNLVQNAVSQMSGLEITYKSHCVSVVSVSKIIFWNAGSETLSSLDIVTANPLRVCCLGDVQLLDAEVLLANNQSSQISVEKADSGNEAIIRFDYLDNNQGGVIQVVHTGLVSADLAVRGDFKGARLTALNTTKSGIKVFSTSFALAIALAVALTALSVKVYINTGFTLALMGVDFGPFFKGLLQGGLTGYLAGFIIIYTLRSPDSRIPRGLRVFR